jgi:hypothetical protein
VLDDVLEEIRPVVTVKVGNLVERGVWKRVGNGDVPSV